MSGVSYALAAFLFWGFMPAYWRLLHGMPAVELLAHRVVWSMAFIGALLVWRRRAAEILQVFRNRRLLLTLTASALLIGGNWLLFIWAVNNGHVLDSSLGYFINPLFNVLLGAVLLKERLTRLQLVAFGLAATGVLILATRNHGVPWIALGLAGSFGLYGFLRKTAAVDSLLGLTVETLLLAPVALVYLLTLFVSGRGTFGHGAALSDVLLALSGVITALPLLWFAHAARQLRLATLGVLHYLTPTCQFALAVFAYGEPFTSTHLLCFGLIWAALAIYTFEATRALATS